jgi:predicted SAM-dependent methyltransferase
MKLNLGCGKDIKDGYINIDAVKTNDKVIVGNIVNLTGFANDSIDEIVLSHVIEHLNNKDLRPALKEWNRVLKQNGKIIISTPNVIGTVKALLNKTLNTNGFARRYKNWSEEEVVFQMIYGRADIFGDNEPETQQHKTGFSYNRLNRFLEECGFKIIKANSTTDDNQDLIIEAIKI